MNKKKADTDCRSMAFKLKFRDYKIEREDKQMRKEKQKILQMINAFWWKPGKQYENWCH